MPSLHVVHLLICSEYTSRQTKGYRDVYFSQTISPCRIIYVIYQDDDPNAVISNIMSEIRSLGLNTDFPPSRLKAGCGDEVRTS